MAMELKPKAGLSDNLLHVKLHDNGHETLRVGSTVLIKGSEYESEVFNAPTHLEFPPVGKANVIYKAESEKKIYQWNTESLEYEIIESIQPDAITQITAGGLALPVLENTVDIPIALSESLGLVKSSYAENEIRVKEDGTMEVNDINVNKLTQTKGDFIVLDSGNSIN